MSIEMPATKEKEPIPTVEQFDPATASWESVRHAVMELEKLCFPSGGFEEEYLKEQFENPENVTMLLKKAERLIGFSLAIPDEDVEGAAYIETTEIHPDEQGHGYVAPLIEAIESEARKRGYRFLTRSAARDNGYADKVEKNYEGRIVESYDQDSEWGPQRYFRIML